jgi:hypothetical protein
MNCDDVVPNPSEREAGLQRIRRLGGLSGIQDLKEGLPRAHGESQPLLKIGHACKCNGGHASRSVSGHDRSRRRRPGMRTGAGILRWFHRNETLGCTPGAGKIPEFQCHCRTSRRDSPKIGSQFKAWRVRVVSELFTDHDCNCARDRDSSARIPMQLMTTLYPSEQMNRSIGPRFRSQVHCRYCADGNLPRRSTISRYVLLGFRTTLKRTG